MTDSRAAHEPVACAACGTTVTGATADRDGWMKEYDPRRGATRVCPDCARRYLRSIEARLDQEWW